MKTKFNYKGVGEICNYYGGLFIMENEGKYYWLIKNFNTDFDDLSDWSEIDKELYDSLVAYDARRSYLEMVERQIEIDNKQDKSSESNGEPLADRFNDGKLEWTLLDYGTLEGLVKVLTFGKIKYGRDNWKKGLKYLSIADSMLRHLFAFLKGEDLDPESGLPHTDHILCNAKFLAYMFNNRKDLDDRENNEINR